MSIERVLCIEWFIEYWVCVDHEIAHWTLNGLLNFEYALNIEWFIEHLMVYWILKKALNVEYAFNIDWVIKLNEDLCVELNRK